MTTSSVTPGIHPKTGHPCSQRVLHVCMSSSDTAKCTCEARKHKLLRNCLACGWIMCSEARGSASCTWCSVPFDCHSHASAVPSSKAKEKLNELLMRDSAKERQVIDVDTSGALLVLEDYTRDSLSAEGLRLVALEKTLEEEKRGRRQVQIRDFIYSDSDYDQ